MGRYASRKFVLSLLVVLLATGLRCLNLIDAAHWVTIVGSAMAFYAAANVTQKAVAKTAVLE